MPYKPIIASVSEHQTVFWNRDQVAGQEVTLRSATRKAAIGSAQGFARCACKTVLQSDAFARNKEMYAPQNATKACLVACVEVKCSVNIGYNKTSKTLQLLLFFSVKTNFTEYSVLTLSVFSQ